MARRRAPATVPTATTARFRRRRRRVASRRLVTGLQSQHIGRGPRIAGGGPRRPSRRDETESQRPFLMRCLLASRGHPPLCRELLATGRKGRPMRNGRPLPSVTRGGRGGRPLRITTTGGAGRDRHTRKMF